MIILIRHARPVIDYARCDYSKALERLKEYNSTCCIDHNEYLGLLDIIYDLINHKSVNFRVSSSPRALATAENIFPNHKEKFIIKNEYREFDLNILPIHIFRFKVKTWFTISRIAWLLGVNLGSRSFYTELDRVKMVASELLRSHENGETIVLVGHGMFNKFLSRAIKKRRKEKSILKRKNGCFSIEVHYD